jgi:hypothetical protein
LKENNLTPSTKLGICVLEIPSWLLIGGMEGGIGKRGGVEVGMGK